MPGPLVHNHGTMKNEKVMPDEKEPPQEILEKAKDPGTVAYALENSLYLNITGGCTAQCAFCIRQDDPHIGPYNLRLKRDPSLEEFRSALTDVSPYREIVFCGFGEPSLRLDVLTVLGRELKERHVPLRLNTNGHGNLIHKRDIVPELGLFLSSISISLNAQDAETYFEICRPVFGMPTYAAVLEFAEKCVSVIPHVVLTVVEHDRIDIPACRKIAEEMGAEFRLRRYYSHFREVDRSRS